MDDAPESNGHAGADDADRTTVYGIIDPADRRVFFVGHAHGARAHRTGEHPKADERIRQIRCAGAMPMFVVLEETKGTEAAERAQVYWVEVFKSRGSKLLNEGGYRPPPKAAKPVLSKEEQREAARNRAAERGLPGNTGQSWTDEQDMELTSLYQAGGKGGKELAEHFQRTRGSIAARLVKLGLIDERRQLQD